MIQFTKSYSGNQYAVIFSDYLTKWHEVFAITDQTALTTAQLLVKEVMVCPVNYFQIVGSFFAWINDGSL